MPRTLKYSGETNLYATPIAACFAARGLGARKLREGGAPAQALRPRGRNRGDGRIARHGFEQAPRFCSFTTPTMTVSAARIPGSMVAAASALRRKTAEQMRSSTEAVT